MKRLVYIPLITLLYSINISVLFGMDFAEEYENQTNQTSKEKFNFSGLPKELQNELTNHIWKSVDNHEIFEKDLTKWNDPSSLMQESTIFKGYRGSKVPVYLYTINNGSPTITEVGTILADARTYSKIWGSLATSDECGSIKLFINAPKKKYAINFYDPNIVSYEGPDINAACLSIKGDLAIVWTEDGSTYKTYMSIFKKEDWQSKQKMSLRDNAQELNTAQFTTHTKGTANCPKIKGCLFMLDGSKLGVCSIEKPCNRTEKDNLINHIKNSAHAIAYFDVKQDRTLTIGQKAKRLQLPTTDAKNILTNGLSTKQKPTPSIGNKWYQSVLEYSKKS